MNQTQNSLSMPENQCVEGLRMMLQGMAMVFGTMAESIGGVPDFPTQTAGRTSENPVPPGNGKASEANASAVQEKPKAAQTASASKKPTVATSPEQVAPPKEAPGGKSITRTDVERAMAAKIKAIRTVNTRSARTSEQLTV